MLDQAKVIEALNEVTEAAARDLKPCLGDVVERVRAETADVPPLGEPFDGGPG